MLKMYFALVPGLAILVSSAGCGADVAATPRNVTTCGVAYTFEVGHKTILSGGCAAVLPAHAPRVTVRLGEQLSVAILHEQSGALDFPVPIPRGRAIGMVSRRGARAFYVARSIGRSQLMARHTRFCLATDPALGTCNVLSVHVVAR